MTDRMRSALAGFGGPNCDPAADTPGVGACHYLNPFGSALTGTGTINPPELIDYIQGPYEIEAATGLTTLDGVVTGEIGQLPGGARPVWPPAPRSATRNPVTTTARSPTMTASCSSWAIRISPTAARSRRRSWSCCYRSATRWTCNSRPESRTTAAGWIRRTRKSPCCGGPAIPSRCAARWVRRSGRRRCIRPSGRRRRSRS